MSTSHTAWRSEVPSRVAHHQSLSRIKSLLVRRPTTPWTVVVGAACRRASASQHPVEEPVDDAWWSKSTPWVHPIMVTLKNNLQYVSYVRSMIFTPPNSKISPLEGGNYYFNIVHDV